MTATDSILSFRSGVDKVDLREIDAWAGGVANESFGFSGTRAAAHSVWFKDVGSDVYLHADVDGNLGADLSLRIVGISQISASDVLL